MAGKTDPTRTLDIFEKMIAIRRFEEVVFDLFEAGEFGGHYHLYIGQESIGAPVMSALGPEDRIFSTHRNHGHLIARGADPKACMAEILGRATGLNGGRGGTFHLSDPTLGMPHTSALVGGAVPLAAGGAFAAKIKKTGGVGVSMFGDGSFEEGVVYETLNLARLWKLPVIFVCENNTPGAVLKSQGGSNTSNLPEGRVIDTPRALGIESFDVDGGDTIAVDALIKNCVARVRSTGEPVFIETLSERWPGNNFGHPQMVTGKTDVSMIWDDSSATGEHAAWFKTHDPLFRLGRTMIADGAATQDQLADIDKTATETMAEAKAFALSSPFPELDTIPDYVLARAGGN
jgi:pyruvate dehydrogenase E1 component alpha subunit